MRLINVDTLELEEFTSTDDVSYAILSHTWGREEVSLKAIECCDDRSSKYYFNLDEFEARGYQLEEGQMQGYLKIGYCCEQAKRDSFDYVWIDTCCIDKTSSAELSEAINSMYKWYSQAKICYAYLDDVTNLDDFRSARWFTRGWTLQELLAPRKIYFYGADWTLLGSKRSLAELLSKATKIEVSAMTNPATLSEHSQHFSIAEKMSWASRRKTTRVEDRAYSLMGIFHVNMPLLYGEGMKAFQRLQHEIIKESTDQSILAWQWIDDSAEAAVECIREPLLAPSPDYFVDSGDIVPCKVLHPTYSTLTASGLQIYVPIIEHDQCQHAVLNCRYKNSVLGPVALNLQVRSAGYVVVGGCYQVQLSDRMRILGGLQKRLITVERPRSGWAQIATNISISLFALSRELPLEHRRCHETDFAFWIPQLTERASEFRLLDDPLLAVIERSSIFSFDIYEVWPSCDRQLEDGLLIAREGICMLSIRVGSKFDVACCMRVDRACDAYMTAMKMIHRDGRPACELVKTVHRDKVSSGISGTTNLRLGTNFGSPTFSASFKWKCRWGRWICIIRFALQNDFDIVTYRLDVTRDLVATLPILRLDRFATRPAAMKDQYTSWESKPTWRPQQLSEEQNSEEVSGDIYSFYGEIG